MSGREVFLPQSYGIGQEAQADQFETSAKSGGERYVLQLFAMRSMGREAPSIRLDLPRPSGRRGSSILSSLHKMRPSQGWRLLAHPTGRSNERPDSVEPSQHHNGRMRFPMAVHHARPCRSL